MDSETKNVCIGVPRAETIARFNDKVRKEARGGSVMVTSGVRGLPGFNVRRLLELLASYDRFDPDNDPHGERDFGDLTFDGADLLWKVDCYDTDMVYGSPDPADPAVTRRVLTVMLASEY